jgi:hypothetical protein
MNLDVLTTRGQISVADEERMALSLERTYPFKYLITPNDQPSVADGMLLSNSTIFAVVETKCRYDIPNAQEFYNGMYAGEWLVTFDKYMRNCELARMLCISLVGIIVLPKSNQWIIKRLFDGSTNTHLTTIRLETTKTQATINGGTANRTNAFIDMRGAKINELEIV